MSEPTQITVEMVSDVCCPWCFLGKRRLDKAIRLVPELDIVVHYRPYQLDPTIPKAGVDRAAYMAAKFNDPVRLKEVHDRLLQMGAADGVQYDFGAIRISPNSLDAHRLLRWAGDAGVQADLKERLLTLYWSEGEDIGDIAVLAGAASDVGMDGAAVAARLQTDEDVAEVTQEIARWQRMGVTGVPTFVFEGKYAVSGAQEVMTLASALREIAEEKAFGPKV